MRQMLQLCHLFFFPSRSSWSDDGFFRWKARLDAAYRSFAISFYQYSSRRCSNGIDHSHASLKTRPYLATISLDPIGSIPTNVSVSSPFLFAFISLSIFISMTFIFPTKYKEMPWRDFRDLYLRFPEPSFARAYIFDDT